MMIEKKFNQSDLNRLYRYCYSFTNDEYSAYDLLQTAFEKYLKKPPQNIDQNEYYLKTIIRNSFIDQYRKDTRYKLESYLETDINQIEDIDTITLEKIIIDQDQLEKIWHILHSFEREILFLWAIEGLSTTAIAKQLNVPKGTVLSRIYRLRHKINKTFNTEQKAQMS